MNDPHFYPIGTPGQAWGQAELAQWRSRQVRQRSYADDVLTAVERLREQMDVQVYGEVVYAGESFPLVTLRSPGWNEALPSVLVTGGVHG
nr:peptidase [Burkholderiaceae bacterium]